MTDICDKIRDFLKVQGVNFNEIQHEPTHTSEESARARGVELHMGAKAILAKTDDIYKLFVLPANARLDSSAIKRALGLKKMRFATREELFDLTGLVPGCVPPFGEPILPFQIYCDNSLGKVSDRIAFNAGSLTNSIIMSAADWERVAQPVRLSFREDNARIVTIE